MEKLQEKLSMLLEKYDVKAAGGLNEKGELVKDGETVPTFPWRQERRFQELKKLTQGGTLFGVSVMRTFRIVEKGADIFSELEREADICEFILGQKLVSVAAVQNGAALNVIARTENGVVCTLEIAATLNSGEKPKDKHEIISRRGIACDVVVDAQLRQESIYVFGAEKKAYTDSDFELYPLSVEDAARVRSAFDVIKTGAYEEMKEQKKHLEKIAAQAAASVKEGEKEEVR